MSLPLSVVVETPALLAGMPYPGGDTDWAGLHARGFRHLVRLHPSDYDAAPLEVHDLTLEDLYGGREPTDAAAEAERVWEAARIAADRVARGEGVLVHCVGGTGRTGTVLACALRLLGRSVEEAASAVRAQRPHWPESPWQEEVVRRAPDVP